MPRKPRLHLPGGFYHVILRGNGRQAIYFDAADRDQWEAYLQQGLTRYGHRIHAYCWMTSKGKTMRSRISKSWKAGSMDIAG